MMLSEIRQSQRTVRFHLYEVPGIATESKAVVNRSWGKGERELLFNWCRISDFQDEIVLKGWGGRDSLGVWD